MAFWMGLSTWLSTSCLCKVRWMALTSVFRVPSVRRAAPSGLRRRAGEFICRARVAWRWSSWLRRIGVTTNRECPVIR